MARSNKDAWLKGPGDLKEADVEDVPAKGQSVRVRGLPAAFSNQASSEALELTTGSRGQQSAKVNTAELEIIQFHHGVIDPKFDLAESRQIAERFGPAFKKVIAEIDRLSGVDKQALEDAESRFQAGETAAKRDDVGNGSAPGSGRPDLPVRTGT